MKATTEPGWTRSAAVAAAAILVALSITSLASAQAPPLTLAEVYDDTVAIEQYWISEKYDGMRAYWSGSRLLTRGGHPIAAPAWFVEGWPSERLDGELWAGRGRFEFTVSTARRLQPDDDQWRQLRFMVFDLPGHSGTFTERLTALHAVVDVLDRPWVQVVEQRRVPDVSALQALLATVVDEGGEGLMLRRADALHHVGRSHDLLKLKPHQDADARVVAHVPGRGKYEGMMGALLVERPDGLRFRLGTGFSDADRRHPPPVGTWISYTHNGVTKAGMPRFARYVRVRVDMEAADGR
ncbi:MAG TPA: DNA ligase [Solimonas sp.]